MLALASLTMLSMANMAYARSGRLQPRMDANECCPCPGPNGDPIEGATTVTVTEAAKPVDPVTIYIPQTGGQDKAAPTPETVTVHDTVTEPAATVFVTKESHPEPSGADAMEEVMEHPQPEPATVTVYPDGSEVTPVPGESEGDDTVEVVTEEQDDHDYIDDPDNGNVEDPSKDGHGNDTNRGNPDGDKKDNTATKTIVPNDPAADAPKTVTVNITPAQGKTIIISPTSPKDSIVTVTAIPEGETPSPDAHEDVKDKVITKTTKDDHPSAEIKTILISHEPSVKTVTLDNGEVKMDTVMTPATLTVTAAPSTETQALVETINNYQTITQSVHNGDNNNIDIEITIININTGEMTCRKEDTGMPCEGDVSRNMTTPAAPSMTPSVSDPCPPAMNYTSIVTAFNTVTVPLGHSWAVKDSNVTEVQPTGSVGLRPRVPRAPLTVRW